MSEQPAEPELERRPQRALAAKLLVALGFAILLLVLRGQAADAVGGPVAPVAGPDLRSDVQPVRAVTDTVPTAVAPVVQVSPRATTAAPRPTEAPARPVERTVRVRPPADDTEVLRLDLDREGLDVEVAPRSPGRVLPIRVQLPSLLEGLPGVEVAIVDGAAVTADRAAPPAEAVRFGAAVVEPGSATTVAAPADRSAEAPHEPSAPVDQAPRLPLQDGTDSSLPTGIATGAGAVVAVLAAFGFRRSAQPSLIVHAAQRRVPVAPALRPSFTPD